MKWLSVSFGGMVSGIATCLTGLRPGDQDVIAYDTQVQLFVSYDQVDCLPDGVVAFRDPVPFFIIDQLAVIDKEKAGLFRYFVKQAVNGIFFFG